MLTSYTTFKAFLFTPNRQVRHTQDLFLLKISPHFSVFLTPPSASVRPIKYSLTHSWELHTTREAKRLLMQHRRWTQVKHIWWEQCNVYCWPFWRTMGAIWDVVGWAESQRILPVWTWSSACDETTSEKQSWDVRLRWECRVYSKGVVELLLRRRLQCLSLWRDVW